MPVEPRPRRANANTHPGQILLEGKQKRRTTTEKAAAAKDKADRVADAVSKRQQDRRLVVARIAQLEDVIQKEDRSYKYKVSAKGASSKARYREAEDDPIVNLR
jgi:hypothetical protein